MRISSLSPGEIRKRIEQSNQDSYKDQAQYIYWENCALLSDYEFMDCPCGSECWCKRRGCMGHYRIKEISFNQFLDTYITLWTPKNARENIKNAVLTGKPFKGRQRNAIPALTWLRQNWSATLACARSCTESGLCDPNINIGGHVTNVNLYEAKMWSQLFYDVLVPFDTASRKEIKRAGYTTTDFVTMNRELFGDLKRFAEAHGLDVVDIRTLDSPSAIAPSLSPLEGGQPLSRVLDKIFYSPKKRSSPADLPI